MDNQSGQETPSVPPTPIATPDQTPSLTSVPTGPNLNALAPDIAASIAPSPESKTPTTDILMKADALLKSTDNPALRELTLRVAEEGIRKELGVPAAKPEEKAA